MDGVVKWFSEEKGYGFITDRNNKDHCFSVRDINGALLPDKGNRVKFDIEVTPKGSRAKNISIIKSHESASDNRLDFCKKCNKKITPRMITYQGDPQRTVCPYCTTTIKEFEKESLTLIDAIIGLFILIASIVKDCCSVIAWLFNKTKEK